MYVSIRFRRVVRDAAGRLLRSGLCPIEPSAYSSGIFLSWPGFPSDIRPLAGSSFTCLTIAPVGAVRWAPLISGRSASDSGGATGPGLNFFATSWKLAIRDGRAAFFLTGVGRFLSVIVHPIDRIIRH